MSRDLRPPAGRLTVSRTVTEHEVTIRRPRRWVYGVLANLDLAHTWQWGLVGSVQRTRGAAVAGVSGHTVRMVGPLRRRVSWTLTEAVDGERVVWTHAGRLVREVRSFAVTQVAPDQVAVRARVEREVPRLLAPLWSDAAVSEALVADLGHLVALLEQGLVDDPSHDGSLPEEATHGVLPPRAAYDLRAAPASADTVSIEVERQHATCTMHCVFCPRTALDEPRDLPPPDADKQAEIAEAFARLLTTWDGADVALWADDVLRYPGLFDLLDEAQRQGRSVMIHSPGTALADRAFAERMVGRAVRFELTVHALDADTWTAMCGNREALPQVLRALDHLCELGIDHAVSIVVTDKNVHALSDVVRHAATRWRPQQISVRVFYPDASELGRVYGSQFPDYAVIGANLRALATDPVDPPVFLSNLPPCQIDPDDVRGARVRLTPNRNALRTYPFPACDGCPAKDMCCGIHPRYGTLHAVRTPDPARVQEVLTLLTAPVDDRLRRRELVPGQVWATVEPRRGGRDYWVAGPDHGVLIERAPDLSPAVGARLDESLRLVGDRVARLPARELHRDALHALVERVARRL